MNFIKLALIGEGRMKQNGEKQMIRSLILAGALVLSGAAVIAQVSAIGERQAVMKGVGKATGDLGKMVKGETPFDLAKAQESFNVYIAAAKKMPSLFPDDSKTGAKTGALPKIWEAKADFNAKFEQFGKDAEAALVSVKDEASFKAAFPGITKNCGGCHESYRAKQS